MVVASLPRVSGLSSHASLTLITVSGMKFNLWSKPHIQSERGHFQDIHVTIAPSAPVFQVSHSSQISHLDKSDVQFSPLEV